jgi:predicted dehydrogenase
MSPLRWCVIGAGSIGQRHLRNLIDLQQTISAVVEPNSALHADLRALGVAQCFTELGAAALAGADAALIATPTHAHMAAALAAAEAGCHLFIEKPLAHTLEHSAALIGAVHERGLTALVGCNMRFHPGPRLLKQMLDSGTIGRPHYARFEVASYLPEWRTGDYRQGYSASDALGGGCVLDAIHEMDLACWFFGFPQSVQASVYPGQDLGIQAEAQAESVWSYNQGPLVSIHQSFMQRWRQRRCEIAGSEGTILWDHREQKVWLWEAQHQSPRVLADLSATDPNQMYRDELEYFIDCVRTGQGPDSDIDWAAQVLGLALETKRAAAAAAGIAA